MALELGNVKPSGFEGEQPTVGRVTPSNADEGNARAGGSRQWIRACTLTFEGGGSALDVSALRVRFQVRQKDAQTPNHAIITVSNFSAETAKRIAQKEFTKVTLSAGYQDSEAVIFQGQIIQVRRGRESPTDTYVWVLATSGDQAYNHATVNKTLASGHTFRDQVDVAAKAMKEFGIELGHIDDLGSIKMPKSRVLFGMARDVLRRVGFATQTSWSIQNDKLQMVKNNSYLPGEAVVMNSRTGMVGLPVQTFEGVQVRCLLNPKIRVGTRLKIDQSSIQEQAWSPAYGSEAQRGIIPALADDGFYKVLVVDHDGDTRGQPWYTDMVCVKADGGISIALAARGIDDAQ